MAQPVLRCQYHGRPATFVNIKNGMLLCDADERLSRGGPLHEALRPIGEVDLAALGPRPAEDPVRGLPPPVRPGPDLRTETISAVVHVSYGQIYIQDGDHFYFEPPLRRGGVGLVFPVEGRVALITGLHTGYVDFAVTIATEDPGPDLSYEDIVESDFTSRTATIFLVEWGGPPRPLPDLPAGSGNYRLRYHGRGLDAAHAGGVVMEGEPRVDSYLLQLWPVGTARPPAILRQTSSHARYWQTPNP